MRDEPLTCRFPPCTITAVTGRWFIPIALLSFGLLLVGLWAYLPGSHEAPQSPPPPVADIWPDAAANAPREIERPVARPDACLTRQDSEADRSTTRRPRREGQSIPWRQLATDLAGRLDDAAVRYRSNVGRSASVQFARGWAEMQAGEHLAAIDHFDQILARQPESVSAASAKASALIAMERFEEAAEVYGDVIRLSPRDAAARYNYGVLLYRLGRFPEAARQFRELVRNAPGHARGQYNLATLAQRAGRLGEARDAWQAYTRLCPDVAEAWFNLGVVWMDFDQPLDAVRCFSRFVDLSPGAPDGWLNLALAYAAGGDVFAAMETLAIADELIPCSEPIMRHLAYLHRLLADQRVEDADEHCRRATRLERQLEPVEEHARNIRPAVVSRHPNPE